MSKNKKGGFFSGALLGSALGAVSYYLFGTKQGKKTQAKIISQSKKTYQQSQPTLKKIELKAKKLATKAQKELKKSTANKSKK